MAIAIGAGVAAVSTLASGAMQAGAAGSAASTQAAAARDAAAMQQGQYTQTRNDLLPYNQNALSLLPTLSSQYARTGAGLSTAYGDAQNAIPQGFVGPQGQAALEATPGYQFNLSQGLKAVQNANAAKGLGVSGSALKSAAAFATGLADNTYQNQFNNQQTQFTDHNQQFSNAYNMYNSIYNQLYGPTTLGENAAAQSGTIGQAGATQAGNNIAGAGQALAAGDLRAGTAYGNALQSAGNSGLTYLALNNALKSTPSSSTPTNQLGPQGDF